MEWDKRWCVHILAPKLSTCVTLNHSSPLSGPRLLACKRFPQSPPRGLLAQPAEGAQSFPSFFVWPPAHTPSQVSLVRWSPEGVEVRGLRTHTAICLRTEDSRQERTGRPVASRRETCRPSPRAARASPCRHPENPGEAERDHGWRGILPRPESDGPRSSVCLPLSAERPRPSCTWLSRL